MAVRLAAELLVAFPELRVGGPLANHPVQLPAALLLLGQPLAAPLAQVDLLVQHLADVALVLLEREP